MRNLISVIILTLAVAAPYTTRALDNNALYQWKTKDGTPTYSPDPPPAGVDYIVVDADLNPLPVQPPRPDVAATSLPTTPAPAAIPAPVKRSVPKWKPIRYATDPSRKRLAKEAAPSAKPAASAHEVPQPMAGVSSTQLNPECLLLKREAQILESYFAEATTDAEMDRAILKLQQKTETYRKQCG